MVSANDFSLLGSTGFDREYTIPRIRFIDETVEIMGVADMKEMVPARRLLRDGFFIDDFPVKAYIVGRVDIYGVTYHTSKILERQDVILVGTSPIEKVSGGLEYVRAVPLLNFNAVYELTERYKPARRDALRSFLQEV